MILHIGYAWLVLGAALLGLAMLDADLPQSAAIHALTAGAIGTMTLAVMTRVTRGHTGRDLSADRATRLIYILVTLAAITRVAAAFAGDLDHAAAHRLGMSLDRRVSEASCCPTARCCCCHAIPVDGDAALPRRVT